MLPYLQEAEKAHIQKNPKEQKSDELQQTEKKGFAFVCYRILNISPEALKL
jgi:hypothetical protein